MDLDHAARFTTPEECKPGQFVYIPNDKAFGLKVSASDSERAFVIFQDNRGICKYLPSNGFVLAFDNALLVPDYLSARHSHDARGIPFGALFLDKENEPALLAQLGGRYTAIYPKDGSIETNIDLYGIYILSWKVIIQRRDNEEIFSFAADFPEPAF